MKKRINNGIVNYLPNRAVSAALFLIHLNSVKVYLYVYVRKDIYKYSQRLDLHITNMFAINKTFTNKIH